MRRTVVPNWKFMCLHVYQGSEVETALPSCYFESLASFRCIRDIWRSLSRDVGFSVFETDSSATMTAKYPIVSNMAVSCSPHPCGHVDTWMMLFTQSNKKFDQFLFLVFVFFFLKSHWELGGVLFWVRIIEPCVACFFLSVPLFFSFRFVLHLESILDG